MKKVLFVISNKDFQDFEFKIPYELLKDNKFDIDIASSEVGICKGVFGCECNAKYRISETDSSLYDFVVFVGGGGAYAQFFKNKDYLNIAKCAQKIAAICIAPLLISDANVLNGKKATVWDDGSGQQIQYIENNGAIYVNKNVVTDIDLITANGPSAALNFAQEILKQFS